MKSKLLLSAVIAGLALAACTTAVKPTAVSGPEPETTTETPVETLVTYEATGVTALTLAELSDELASGSLTSVALVEAYLARIDRMDKQGPALHSVLALNPSALEDARKLDEERAAGSVRGPMHGIPILVKDNIETADKGLATTAGALALKDNITGRDAPLIARLREEGAIILGKTNLSQWANFRSTGSISGWSALGGQVRNPHILSYTPCGSSSGSGAAMAASFAAATIGTETNGSILCPATSNGIVGFKPTVGMVSRTHVVPISFSQDTAGPMTKTVRDAAIMLTAMAAADPQDPATANVDWFGTDFAAALHGASLEGKRIGVMRFAVGSHPAVTAHFEAALEKVEAAGAELVDITEYDAPDEFWGAAFDVLKYEFKATLNDYLANTPEAVETRDLASLIAFNEAHADQELVLFNQDILEMSEALGGLEEQPYKDALALVRKATREDGIDKFLADTEVDILVAPTRGPAFIIDAVNGDQGTGGVGAGWMAAIAGYPQITLPMGLVKGLPVGFTVMDTAWEDSDVLTTAHAIEKVLGVSVPPQYYYDAWAVPDMQSALVKNVE